MNEQTADLCFIEIFFLIKQGISLIKGHQEDAYITTYTEKN